MKILKLHFKNLNSLAGEWLIDFTVPEYGEQGIFAITGPTGAGKSTILDAICLALYGRTPRLDKITASQNEIMSRQTGECFASLEFQTSSGHYRSLWSQARARKKAEGNLQNAQHIIEDSLTQTTLEDKLSKTPAVVSEVTGMDFEHFTRAMLLAQGGFAKFLQSSGDERSPILEKITGTEIYSQISKLVHERKNTEDNKLSSLTEQLSGIKLLTSQEEQGLQNELNALESKIRELMSNKSELEQQQLWLVSLQRLRDELANIAVAQQHLQLAQAEFANDELRLKSAQLADEINSDIYISLQALRTQIAKLTQDIALNQQQLPALQTELASQQNMVTDLSGALSNYRLTHAMNLKTLQQVRLLDAEIVAKQQRITEEQQRFQRAQDELGQLIQHQQQYTGQQQEKLQQSRHISEYLIEHSPDGELVSSFSGISGSLDNLQSLALRIRNYQTQQSHEQTNHQNLTTQLDTLRNNESKYQNENNNLTVVIREIQHRISQIAANKTVVEIKDEILQFSAQQSDYRELAKNLQEKSAIEQGLEKLSAELSGQQQSIAEAKPQLSRESELLAYSNQLIDNLTAQKILQSKIISLSDERRNLHAQQPCPLCGALEHPYAANGVVINDELDLKIAAQKQQVGTLQTNITQLTATLATGEANLGKLTANQQDLHTRLAALQPQITLQLAKHSLIATGDVNAAIQAQLIQLEQQLTRCHQQIEELQAEEAKLRKQQDQQLQIEAELLNLKISASELVAQQTASQNNLIEIERNLALVQREYQELFSSLTQQLAIYQIALTSADEIVQIKASLNERLVTWQTQQQHAEGLKEQLQYLAHQLEQNHSLQENLTLQLNALKHEITRQSSELQEITAKRFTLFGDKNCDSAERQWQQELQQLEQQASAAETKLNQLTQQQTTLVTLIEKDQQQLQPMQSELVIQEQLLLTKLAAANLVDENDFIAKRLSREEMAAIQRRQDDLNQQKIELNSRHQQSSERLINEESQQLTTKTISELQTEIVNTQTNYDEYNQQVGQLRGQLVANQQAQTQQKDIIELRDKQHLIAERFRRLHVLIGSSDGKKFRNFAQGLTFELVVKHANQQLQRMSDRYLLMRDKEAPLELNVIDNYQGGEIRTTKNLSGGESFVISLALSLGLSQLSSNKVQVDSLFLDEGFGTLDEDALQTALDALDSLQRDGKLIGIISHVGALKERINLQIQVEPLSGGVSKISGVGCSRK